MRHFKIIISLFVIPILFVTTVSAQKATFKLLEPQPLTYTPSKITNSNAGFPESFHTQSGNTSESYSTNSDRVNFARTSKGNAGEGFLYGALGGAVLGGLVGAIAYTPCDDTGFLACMMHPESRGHSALLGAVAGAALGGLVGMIIGSFETTSVGRRADVSPVLYKTAEPGSSAVYHGATLRIKF